MTAFSVAPERLSCQTRLSFCERFDFDMESRDQQVQSTYAIFPFSRFQDHRSLQQAGGRHPANGTFGDGHIEKMAFWLLKQHGDHDRRVDDHEGSPFSSQLMISSSVRVSKTGSEAQ